MVLKTKSIDNKELNKLLFEMFIVQNADKSFDNFVELTGEDKNYIGIKLNELNYIRHSYVVKICKPEHKFILCEFYYDTGKFHGFSIDQKSDRRINILDHISFEDIL